MDIKPCINSKPCIKYKEIVENYDSSWSEYCWPDCLFQDSDYPCRKCSIMKERYDEYLKVSIRESLKDKNNSIHHIMESCRKDGGKIVDIGLGECGLLVGATATLEDYYWVIIDKDKKIQFETCVGKYKIVDDVPKDCKFLLDKKNESELFNLVIKGVNATMFDIMITPIYI